MKKSGFTMTMMCMIVILILFGNCVYAESSSRVNGELKNGRFYISTDLVTQIMGTTVSDNVQPQLVSENDYSVKYDFYVDGQKVGSKAFLLNCDGESFDKFTLDLTNGLDDLDKFGNGVLLSMIIATMPEDIDTSTVTDIYSKILNNENQVQEYEGVNYLFEYNNDVVAFRIWPTDRKDDSFDSDGANNDPEAIAAIQNMLNILGYDCGVADGIAGEKTRSSIKKYQVDHGLDVTGTITGEMFDCIAAEGNSHINDNNTSETVQYNRDAERIVNEAKGTTAGQSLTYNGPVSEGSAVGYNVSCNNSTFVVLFNAVNDNDSRLMVMMKNVSTDNEGASDYLTVLTAFLHGIDSSISESTAKNKLLEMFDSSDRKVSYHNISIEAVDTYVIFQY